MSSDLKPANAKWRSLILYLLWIPELFFFGVYTVTLGLLIGITTEAPEFVAGPKSNGKSPAQAWMVVSFVMAAIGVLFTCIEIVLQSQQDLWPSMFLASSIIKMFLVIISIILDAYATSQSWFRKEYNKYLVYCGIGWTCIIFIAMLPTLAYATIMYHQNRMRAQELMRRYV